MLAERQARAILEGVMARSSAEQTEVLLLAQDSSLTRFAESEIHQNVFESNTELRIRTVNKQRIGVASTNDLGAAAIQRALDAAHAASEHVPPDPRFKSLPGPQSGESVPCYVEATANCSPVDRAKRVGGICKRSLDHGFAASGAFQTEVNAVAVANSLGIFRHEMRTSADLKIVITGENSSGFAERSSNDVNQIDADEAGAEAVDRAVRSRDPLTLGAGTYPVVLEEYAVAELLDYLSYIAFGGLAFLEGRSFLADRIGETIMGSNITIWDDGRDSAGIPASFDFEGVPKQRVTIIDEGVARGVVHDSFTAGMSGVASTGHALPAPNSFGPFAGHLLLASGDQPRAALAQGIQRGLWITRFHYVNVADPKRAVLTGMTRDGTFLIENGELTRAVRNLRFTQDIPEAFRHVGALSRETRAIESWLGASVVPAMRVDGFTFTGATVA